MIGRIAKLAVLAILVFAAAGAAAWIYVAQSGEGRIQTSTGALAPLKAGLVLGTSQFVRGRPNAFFSTRMEAAAQLFASGKAQYLIVSGNQAHGGRAAGGYDEPSDMRDALIAAGVPAERIYRDYAGFRTLDSILRAKAIFDQDHVTVVSQRFHLERALFLAKANGLEFQGFEAEDVALRHQLLPRLREFGARLLALADIAAGRKPRYGGGKIALGVDPPS